MISDTEALSPRPTLVAPVGLADPRLEALAHALAAALPCTDPVSVALLNLLALSRPVGRRDLAVALAVPEAMVSAAMRRMPYLEVDAEGGIVGCGLTLVPTDHEIAFTGPWL